MKKWLNNEQGLTLTELLATLVISSIILVSVISAFVFIQKQYGSQAENIEQQTDIAVALKSITKDARVANTFIEENDHQTLRLQWNDEEVIYTFEDAVLKRNDTNYIFDIADFWVAVDEENKLEVHITSTSGKKLSTEIVKRGGHDNAE